MTDQKINPQEIILVQGARILFPSHWEFLLEAMREDRYKKLCTALLLSGLRPIEADRLQPAWYRGPLRCLVLPDGACLKDRCEYKARTVRLGLPGCDAVDAYIHSPDFGKLLPSRDRVTFRDTLIRYADAAGIGTQGISAKMFRKTCASWLTACFPERQAYIQASMGHCQDTMARHYLGIAFPEVEIEKMRKYHAEWGRGA